MTAAYYLTGNNDSSGTQCVDSPVAVLGFASQSDVPAFLSAGLQLQHPPLLFSVSLAVLSENSNSSCH